jgi:hypothetical protein
MGPLDSPRSWPAPPASRGTPYVSIPRWNLNSGVILWPYLAHLRCSPGCYSRRERTGKMSQGTPKLTSDADRQTSRALREFKAPSGKRTTSYLVRPEVLSLQLADLGWERGSMTVDTCVLSRRRCQRHQTRPNAHRRMQEIRISGSISGSPIRNSPVAGRGAKIAKIFLRNDLRNTPGRIRTCDHRFRKPVLYPLSYEGKVA